MMSLVYNSNYLSYYSCISQTKSDTITQKGADHVAAQCKAFILEKTMVKKKTSATFAAEVYKINFIFVF